MKKHVLYVSIIATIILSSCVGGGESVKGSGNVTSESRQVSNAKKIKVMGDMDVFVEQGPNAIRIEGDDNILQYVETSMKGDWLEINTREDINLNTEKPIKIYITTPEITDLHVLGSGNINSSQKFSTDENTSFNISGSGDINAVINAPKVEVRISGSGNLQVAGETKDVSIKISGSGNYDGPELKAENAEVTIAGSGNATVFADSKLRASVAGSGDIKYTGNAVVDTHIAGSGTVTKN